MKRKRDDTSFYTFFVSTNVLIVQQRSLYQKRHRVAHFVSNFVALAIFALFFRAICGHVKRSDCRKLKNTNCKLITLKILLKSRSVFSTFLLLLCFSWCLFLFFFYLLLRPILQKPLLLQLQLLYVS